MWKVGFAALVASIAVACGDDLRPPPETPDPSTSSAQALYGLEVGARWTYLRSGDVLRWKEITACEDVLILDPTTGESRLVRAYVRENRSTFGTTSVHYLVVDAAGDVRRVRRDDVDEGNLVVLTTYDPAGLRLPDGPYGVDDSWAFSLRTGEFDAVDRGYRGASDTSAIDRVFAIEDLDVIAGTYEVVGVERQWDAFNAHNVKSYYAVGIGEVLEETEWSSGQVWPPFQIEQLVSFAPGYGTCDGTSASATSTCDEPLIACANPWDTGVPGCADPRVDPANCGGCGLVCASGVCAGGACQESACGAACEGTTICCPSAWSWGVPGCTSPSRDRWNCGGCGVVCPVGLTCDHGACTCGPHERDCGGGCQDVLSDQLNCGACGNVCDGDTPTCDKGICVGSCVSVELTSCGAECVDLAWNDDHCGECGAACGGGTGTTTCIAGDCVTCEAAGLTNCEGDCANLDWSDRHCGACGNACGGDQVCLFGACVGGDGTCDPACADGDKICCDGACIDPRTNDHHCGGCGVDECAGGCTEACRQGACTPVDCGGGDD